MRDHADIAIDWDGLDSIKFADERKAAGQLDRLVGLDEAARARAGEAAVALVERARETRRGGGLMESFLQEFGLSNKEGLALMCLAEALLRVPDGRPPTISSPRRSVRANGLSTPGNRTIGWSTPPRWA
jgi:RHH-type proline utilization regulon transcriptional repressor/proline dehydrogenase/delta 1-pyrroline-5-carboxylate dehydrogenase